MPTIRPNVDGGEKRTTFRPPWVKEGPPSLPAPPPVWVGKQQEPVKSVITPSGRPKLSNTKNIKASFEDGSKLGQEVPKKVETNNFREEKLKPETSKPNANNIRDEKLRSDPSKPVFKAVNKEGKPPEVVCNDPRTRDVKVKSVTVIKDQPAEEKIKSEIKGPFQEIKLRKTSREGKQEEAPAPKSPAMSAPPPPPPPPPASMPPAPPPPPLPPVPGFKKQPITQERANKLEALRSRPRRRPDWTDMMKEVEKGIKLNHVTCNDRSAPIIPKDKAKGQFVYESEKQNAHNLLLKEIQGGIHLKKVKTNDRSKPILDGLRKFRRQMTIEELIQKSASVADVIAVASEPDELDDIDKVRDDLQSTKQMLALELRNKEALERENKRIMSRLLNLEAELEKEKLTRKIQTEGASSIPIRTVEDEKLISQLKEEAAESAHITKEMEDKYHKTAEELDHTRAKLESAWLRNTQLEMELKSKGSYNKPPLVKQPSCKKLVHSSSIIKQDRMPVESDSEGSETETEGEYDDDEDEEDTDDNNAAEKAANREQRELKLLTQKLKTYKEKQLSTLKEKKKLKDQLHKLQKSLKEEEKKYKLLQKEVDKMAKLMKEVEEEEEPESDEDESDENDEESESESESDEDDGTESEGDLPAEANIQDKINNLNKRIKYHENILTKSKKANYLLKANIDWRQDDLNRQKEMALALQEDLNAVLSELG